MNVKRAAHPDCINASNPYHECVDDCFRKMAKRHCEASSNHPVLERTIPEEIQQSHQEDVRVQESSDSRDGHPSEDTIGGDLSNLTGRQKKMFELRLKMNEARKANQIAMVAEKKRMEAPSESRGISKDKRLEERKKKDGKLLEVNGLDMTKAYMLDTQEAAEAKYRKWEKDPAPSGRDANMKMKYPSMKFGGRIVYCRTFAEVQRAAFEIIRLLKLKKQELGRAILGVDIEWKPSFTKGIPQRKAAVLQICGDMEHCYVLHIIHSGIPQNLRSLLEDPTSIKVGVGIDDDGVKMLHDHNVSIKPVEDLSSLANKKLGGASKHCWSLSSLVETLTSQQLLKPKKIRLGNWEASLLGKQQLEYAATDAFASWYVYEVLHSFPEPSTENEKKE